MALTKLTKPRARWSTFKAKVVGAVERALREKLQENGVSIMDLGAVGGDADKDTAAFITAFTLGIPISIPSVPIDKAFIIKGEVELPSHSVMKGASIVRSMYNDKSLSITQSYITFADASSRFVGGSSASNRVFLYWSNIVFIGSNGYKGNVGTAIGRKTGNDNSAMGGKLKHIGFSGFDLAWENDWAYFLQIDYLDLTYNNKGLKFDDWNASSISNVYGTGGGEYYINTGADSARSVFRNIGMNMNSRVKVGIYCDAGVTFEGYNYFETFGTPEEDNPNMTCIALSTSRYSGRPVSVSNCLFSVASAAYCVTIGQTGKDQGHITYAGGFYNCKFVDTTKAKVGFGVHEDPRHVGEGIVTHPIVTIEEFKGCRGINRDDLIAPANSPYRDHPISPIGSYVHVAESTHSTNSYEWVMWDDQPRDKATFNNTSTMLKSSKEAFIIPKSGVYKVSFHGGVLHAGVDRCTPEFQLLVDGKAKDSSILNIPPKEDAVYESSHTVRLGILASLDKADIIQVRVRSNSARSPFTLKDARIVIEYIGECL